MEWINITPETDIDPYQECLFGRYIFGEWITYKGWIPCKGALVFTRSGSNEDVPLEKYTHYCIITPPKE